MAIQFLDDTPGGDSFQDLYDKFNNNADEFIVTVSQLAGVVTLTKEGGGTFTIDLPAGVNQILTGLIVTVGGVGPYTADYTSGTYQISGDNFSILPGGSLAISTPHATLNRLDVVIVDDVGAISILTGTPAAIPAAPTVLSYQLAVSYIYVPAAGVPVVQPPISNIPGGLVDGDTLRWHDATQQWVINPGFRHDGVNANMAASSGIGIAVSTNAYVDMTTTEVEIRYENGTSSDYAIRVDSAGVALVENPSADESYFDQGLRGGMRLVDNVPASTANRLYNDGGSLYWDGDLVCTAPCGGGGLPTVSIDDTDSPYAADPDAENTILVSAAAGDVDVTLPGSPSADAEIIIKVVDDPNPTYTVNIDRNGNTIDGQALDLILSNRSGVHLKWDNVGGWVIVSSHFYTRRLPVSSSQALAAAFYPTMVSVDTVTAGAPTTMTLPASPLDGQEFIIKDRTGAAPLNTITVSGNGNTVDGAGGRVINTSRGSFTLRYCVDNTNWEIIQ